MKLIGILFIIAIIFILLWLGALIDVLCGNFKNPSNKTAWILVLLFIPPLGMILYLIYGYWQKVDAIPIDYKKPPVYKPKDEDRDGWKL